MRHIIFIILISSIAHSHGFTQTQHFSFKSNTDDSYSIVVTEATIAGISLETGDEIGIFTPADLCVGAEVWTGTTMALAAWIDDSQTIEIDGYKNGELISFKIWDKSSDNELYATPTYAIGNGTFGSGVYTMVSINADITTVEEINAVVPISFRLCQNFPNPFNPTTTIQYSLPQQSHVKLSIYNVLGDEIATLVNEEQHIGDYSFHWNSTDKNNKRLASGIYVYRLQAGGYIAQNKMILMK